MNSFVIAVLTQLLSVFIAAVSQIMLKVSANKEYNNKLAEYLNPLVITAYAMFVLSTLLTMFALRKIPLSLSPILESTSYIYVTVMGYFLLKEKLSRKKLVGLGLILFGILVFSVGSK